jgi:hypothetical protein
MTRNKTHALLHAAALALCAALLAGFPPQAGAQTAPSPTPYNQQIIKTHFVVEHMFLQSLQVHSVTDFRALRTFVYSPKIRERMQEIFNAGGYQYGDRVTIWYRRDGDVAVKIKGRPSPPK